MEKTIKPAHVKSHMKIFVNCLVENPAFDSQTKEFMSLKQSAFGSKCPLSDKFLKGMLDCGILESILTFAQSKQNKDMKKTDGKAKGRLTGIAKLDDANEAGGRNGNKCTLIITEGDSAKARAQTARPLAGLWRARTPPRPPCAHPQPHNPRSPPRAPPGPRGLRPLTLTLPLSQALAVSGLSVIGRDYYGVFPLRGKLLNVRDAPHSTIMNNKEISELKQILGLQQGKDYSDEAARKSLRYGHLMIMTDQDHDGSHIKARQRPLRT